MTPETDEGADEERLVPLSGVALARLFYLFLLVWAVYLFVASRPWRFEDKFLVTVVTIPLAALLVTKILILTFPGILKYYRKFVPEKQDESLLERYDDDKEELPRAEQERNALGFIVWIIGYVGLLYLVGFVYSSVTFTLLFVGYYRRDLKETLAVTLIAIVFLLFFFELLNVRIWTGILEPPNVVEYLR